MAYSFAVITVLAVLLLQNAAATPQQSMLDGFRSMMKIARLVLYSNQKEINDVLALKTLEGVTRSVCELLDHKKSISQMKPSLEVKAMQHWNDVVINDACNWLEHRELISNGSCFKASSMFTELCIQQKLHDITFDAFKIIFHKLYPKQLNRNFFRTWVRNTLSNHPAEACIALPVLTQHNDFKNLKNLVTCPH